MDTRISFMETAMEIALRFIPVSAEPPDHASENVNALDKRKFGPHALQNFIQSL